MKTAVNVLVLLLLLLSVWALLTPNIKVGSFVRGGAKDLGMKLGLDLAGGTQLVLEADFSQLPSGQDQGQALTGAMNIVQTRVNKFGVTEATVQRQPAGNRIIVQLPGVKDVAQAVKLIGQTAQLDFRKQELDASGQPVKDASGNVVWVPATGTLNGQPVALTGKYLKPNAQPTLDTQTNTPAVSFTWDADGATLFEQITTELLHKPLGIFLDNQLISAPTVNAVIKDSGIITGLTTAEAKLLAAQLNGGALPIPLKVVQQQNIGASLGSDSLHKSLLAGAVGLALVLLFMIIYYRLPGLVAGLALLYYGALVLAIFKLIPVTLSLAGIAGFVVSLGMAVDANVLIFERTKEELRAGVPLRGAIERGFARAWTAIRDSNITTFIACIVLYWFGSRFGAYQVMGFALTLFIGVAVSMFTALIVTRALLRVSTALTSRLLLYRI